MRVVKPTLGLDYQKHVDVIVGEMLNKETSLYYWNEGVRNVVGDGTNGTITAADYNGYPKIVSGNVRQTVKAAYGYIFVTADVDMRRLSEDLRAAIVKKEEVMADLEPLDRYHTRAVGYHTNIKVRSQQRLTVTDETAKKTANNVRRWITNEQGDARYTRKDARFIWFVRELRMFNPTISRDYAHEAVANYLCSILYDAADATTLTHNETLTNYSLEFHKATPLIIKNTPELRINSNMPPIMSQIYGSYWHALYAIPVDIYNAKLDQIEPVPAKTNETGVFSIEHCTGCRRLLYDDVYAFVDKVDPDTDADIPLQPLKPYCHMFCAICAHGKAALYALGDGVYTRVLRVTWPRTPADIIAQYDYPNMRPLLTELHTHGYQIVGTSGDKNHCILVGDRFVAIPELDNVKFGALINDPQIAGREIIGFCSGSRY